MNKVRTCGECEYLDRSVCLTSIPPQYRCKKNIRFSVRGNEPCCPEFQTAVPENFWT